MLFIFFGKKAWESQNICHAGDFQTDFFSSGFSINFYHRECLGSGVSRIISLEPTNWVIINISSVEQAHFTNTRASGWHGTVLHTRVNRGSRQRKEKPLFIDLIKVFPLPRISLQYAASRVIELFRQHIAAIPSLLSTFCWRTLLNYLRRARSPLRCTSFRFKVARTNESVATFFFVLCFHSFETLTLLLWENIWRREIANGSIW